MPLGMVSPDGISDGIEGGNKVWDGGMPSPMGSAVASTARSRVAESGKGAGQKRRRWFLGKGRESASGGAWRSICRSCRGLPLVACGGLVKRSGRAGIVAWEATVGGLRSGSAWRPSRGLFSGCFSPTYPRCLSNPSMLISPQKRSFRCPRLSRTCTPFAIVGRPATSRRRARSRFLAPRGGTGRRTGRLPRNARRRSLASS